MGRRVCAKSAAGVGTRARKRSLFVADGRETVARPSAECDENRGKKRAGTGIKSGEKGDKFGVDAAATFVRRGGRGLLPIVVRTGINVGKKAREEG